MYTDMKLANLDKAVLTRDKVSGYLLSWSHPSGQSKARFFNRFGFRSCKWEILAKALTEHAESNEVYKVEETCFGLRYTVEGPIETPDGRAPNVRVVWFVRYDEIAPRLVTAYPCLKEKAE